MSARLRVGVALALCSIAAVGCDHLLKVQDPDVASPQGVSGADKLSTQLGATVGAFQVNFGGDASGDEGLVNITGLFTDEFSFTETFPTRIVIDQRNMTNNNSTLLTIFFNAEQSRSVAATASDQFNKFGPNNKDHSQVLSLEAYSQLLLAEVYCGAVPFSTQNTDGTTTNETPLTRVQMLQTAVATFDSAIKIAVDSGDASREFLARVGKARALLDIDSTNLAVADTVVANVPTTFVYQVLHSLNTQRENNGVNELIFQEGRWSVSDTEGTNGLNFVSANDPRVPTAFLGRGFVSRSKVWGPLNDSSRASPDILASGVEARLIQAEAALAKGDASTWLADLNALRAGATFAGGATLAPLSDPGTPASRMALLFRERGFWLFASAHRLGDFRRLTRPTSEGGYGLAINAVYPSGAWVYRGAPDGTYGSDVVFPVPLEEGNNPSFNASQCDVTVP
ncbi:MAG TPA: hypothetical protein VJN96_08245 [Vicinamibacterales bacterium]|nr:hypothetical protein [Vicinamibacterales bacterium]